MIKDSQNPITWAEKRHQRYIIEQSRSGRFWIFLALLLIIPAFVTSFAFFIQQGILGRRITFVLPPDGTTLDMLIQVGIVTLLVATISHGLVMGLMPFGLVMSSIQREREKKTWDVLRMTTLQTRRLVNGKLWGSLYALRGDYVGMVLLRVGLSSVFVSLAMAFYNESASHLQSVTLYFGAFVALISVLDLLLNVVAALFCVLSRLTFIYLFFRLATAFIALWIINDFFAQIFDYTLFYLDGTAGYGVPLAHFFPLPLLGYGVATVALLLLTYLVSRQTEQLN